MSQEHYKGKAKTSLDRASGEEAPHPNPPATSRRPKYMTGGTGSAPESAARLQALLNSYDNADTDSGYGGSVAGDSINGAQTWNPNLTEDRPTPSHSPMTRGQLNEATENERRAQAVAI